MDNKKVIRSAGLVSVFILISRGFGLIRDMAMAAFFGSSVAMDAFVVAFTIPNLFRGLFGEGALSSALVPVFTDTLEKKGRDHAWRFASNMLSLLSLVLAGLVVAGILLASALPAVIPLSPRVAMILSLLQIMLPYTFFICLAAFFSAMLNALRHFVLPAATPVVLNLVMIAALFFVCPYLEAEGRLRMIAVAWSVIMGGAIQWIMQWPLLFQYGFRIRWTMDWSDPGVRRVVQLMGVAVIGTGMTQLSVLLDRFVAVFIGQGSASYLYYAERLIYFPLGIFATALGTVLLPAFSGQVAKSQTDQVRQTLNHSIRQLMFIMLPAAIGLLALATPIVRLVYERGDFSSFTTHMTAVAVQCYAPGLVVFSLLKVLIPVFYAHQDMKTPVRVSIACTALNIVLKLALILWWQVRPFPYAYAGIASATVVSSTAAVVTLGYLVHRRVGSPGWRSMATASMKILAASLIMAVAAVMGYQWLSRAGWLTALPGPIRLISAVLGGMGIAVGAYVLAAAAFRCHEMVELWNAVRHRSGEPPPIMGGQ